MGQTLHIFSYVQTHITLYKPYIIMLNISQRLKNVIDFYFINQVNKELLQNNMIILNY